MQPTDDDENLPLTRRDFLVTGSAVALASAAPSIEAQAQTTSSTRNITHIQINGELVVADVEARVTLLDFLRDRRHLTGTKKGCNEGACGTCTVLIDGKRMNSCLTLTAQCAGRDVVTIEGIGSADALHPVQQAFIDHDAFQCGYCTPGQIVSAVACIAEGHATGPDEVREWMSGNICRCAAYPQITAAVLDAAAKMRG
ncbi:(2Fe-2S)-binding protein [Neorhizobium sp. DAR64872/K0K18]|uniref:(2Fe-2S)-binding protein n=1 Tax=Neorhizobium sp. DAR64872/K0K18 TaxID=3421958 RepID=UPI003D26B3C8